MNEARTYFHVWTGVSECERGGGVKKMEKVGSWSADKERGG